MQTFARWRLLLTLGLSGAFLYMASPLLVASEPLPANAIEQELRSLRELGSVLFVAAHPDDENTQLIAFLARGRNYRTAYLSLTRGDGGQNVLGSDLGEKLGVARTQELLAARQLDGGQQFFTRALDFGFSKDYRETLSVWNKQEVLADIVRVIRTFRPDVMVTRFSTRPGGTHGHHTTSAVLALEAFKLAGDPNAFPEQLDKLTVWQPKRIFWNSNQGRGGSAAAESDSRILKMEVNGKDPLSNLSFGELAGRSRAMHKTQGFDSFAISSAPRTESFQLLDGEPANKDIMDGVETSWARVPGGAEIQRLVDDVIAHFSPADPSASVPALLTLRTRVAALAADPVVTEKRAQLERILQSCLGLSVETKVTQSDVVPGETLKMRESALVTSHVPVRWVGVRSPGKEFEGKAKALDLRAGEASTRETEKKIPRDMPLTQPYYLREESTPGMFRVADPSLIGRPENPPAFPIEQVFEVGGQTLVIPDEPVQIISTPIENGHRARLNVIPPVSLHFVSDVQLFEPGSTRSVEVEVVAARADTKGSLHLDAPKGWKIEPSKQAFKLEARADHSRFTFTVTAPKQSVVANLGVVAEVGGTSFRNEHIEVRYAHIPLQLLQPPARIRVVSLELAKHGDKVGYLPGAGDSVDNSLKQMGYAVTTLTGFDLTLERLKEFDAVVIGVRAFNVRTDFGSHMSALFEYVKGGGTIVAQYNRPDGLKVDAIAPYSLKLSGARVTDENAAVTFLAPDNAVLTTPNKISAEDFSGWVQERGLYFPNQWDERFIPILACGDEGEAPLKGGLLVATYGRGYFIYTGLSFFRQLPAGVPGAYRLFANLVSAGK